MPTPPASDSADDRTALEPIRVLRPQHRTRWPNSSTTYARTSTTAATRPRPRPSRTPGPTARRSNSPRSALDWDPVSAGRPW
ncbi:hypothetical protein ACRAWF_12425 [Streptomyces sp. L7]